MISSPKIQGKREISRIAAEFTLFYQIKMGVLLLKNFTLVSGAT